MKKRILCIVLTLCTVMTILPMAVFAQSDTAKKITDYSVGDTLEYGYYPQSKVTDEATIKALNDKVKVDTTSAETITASTSVASGWTSYGYYIGTGDYDDGQMTASDYMRYTDVVFGGNKYRGIVFDSYRPYGTGYTSSSSYQDDNGYSTKTVYWFKYEPITWRVLDPATGMVMSEAVLDSQAFNNYFLSSGTDEYNKTAYWGSPEKKYYANNYAESSIKKWLNNDFYNTSFSTSQQNIIVTTTLDNSAYDTKYSEYSSATTNDKIYLLSYSDVSKTSYGFSSDSARAAQGSDYAKSQGLRVQTSYSSEGKPYWYLRSAGNYSYSACYVSNGGGVHSILGVYYTDCGVRPAMNFDTSVTIVQEPLVNEKGGVTVSGTVKSFATSGSENKSTTIELISSGKTVYTTSVVGTGEQSYSIEGVSSGTYILRVSKSDHVTREYEITVDGADVKKALVINLKGDVNGDGKITVTDYVKVLQHAKGMSTLESYDFACGDVDGNNKITVTDYVRILQHAKGTEYLW